MRNSSNSTHGREANRDRTGVLRTFCNYFTRSRAQARHAASPRWQPLKTSFQQALTKLGGKTKGAAASGVSKPAASMRDTHSPGFVATITRTGETIFDHRALRFQSLTLNAADIQLLEHPHDNLRGFKIRVAKHAGRRRHAGDLVEKRYAGRGYTTSQSDLDPNLSTFIAYDEGALVGTVSVRLDSPVGLTADDLYLAELDALRDSGYRLCEFTRLAVDRAVASKPVLAGLFHTAYLYAAVIHHCTHAVIEVNPRHVTFYRRALGFERLGDERMNRRVNAPAVLLGMPFATIAESLRMWAGKPPAAGAGRSLFRHGFPADEEGGVLDRLRVLVSER